MEIVNGKQTLLLIACVKTWHAQNIIIEYISSKIQMETTGWTGWDTFDGYDWIHAW